MSLEADICLQSTETKYLEKKELNFPLKAFYFSGVLPPRTLTCAVDRHREVRRQNSGELSSPRKYVNDIVDDNAGNFSDDSLEEAVSPVNKRGSIAWEVPLGFEDEEPYYAPGSTKVIGRRRRKSTEHSNSK